MNSDVLNVTTYKLGEITPINPENKQKKELSNLYNELDPLNQNEIFEQKYQKATPEQEKELENFCYLVNTFVLYDNYQEIVSFAKKIIAEAKKYLKKLEKNTKTA